MKRMLMVLAVAALPIYGQQVIAQDSEGLIVEVKEKYGGIVVDTCTVVMLHDRQFVVVNREGGSGWFPASFHSVRIVGRLRGSDEQLAAKEEFERPEARI
ncbi:MAG: hypothetical protein GF418_00620, partial [Chitinivibrionales bacterium]|nr:hypothetical protein [Chitinivibrionales bacterium]MBD3394103.1 hypothetical protein [Chitinivibrionales bacterium]